MRRNSIDQEIRDLERRIGSGNYDAADPMRLHALVSRAGPPGSNTLVIVFGDNGTPGETIQPPYVAESYKDRDSHSATDAANAMIGLFSDDVALMLYRFLDPPEVDAPRERIVEGLSQVIERDLQALYGRLLMLRIRREAFPPRT